MPAPRPPPADLVSAGLGAWIAVLLLVCALAYAVALPAPFIFDDDGAVVRNPTILRLGPEALRPPSVGSTTSGRPITNLTFALDRALTRGAPWGYRLTNVAIHALAALALLALVRRTLMAGRERFGLPPTAVAGSVALLWAVHPLQTESVTCIAQRTESLCGLLVLLSLAAFARGAGTGRRRWLAASVAACAVGMGVKEVMAVAPVLVLLYDRTFVAGSFAGAWRARRGYYRALAATWIPLAALVLDGGAARGASAGFDRGVSSWDYLLTQADALLLYLRLAIWPHPLVLDYGTAVVSSWREVWWQGPTVLALLAATGWALVRRPAAGFLGAAFFLVLAPSSSVVPLVTQTVAEHRMYLPLAAVLLLLTAWAGPAIRRWPRHAAAAVAVLAAGGLVGTVDRNRDYRSATTLWADNVAQRPGNPRGHLNLALALAADGDKAAAGRHFARAVALGPDYVSGHYNHGTFLLGEGRWEEAAAALARAVALAPDHADAQVNLGTALVRAGRAADALPHFAAALRLAPEADVAYNHGQALLALGRETEARDQFAAALRLQPDLALARSALARLDARGEPRTEPELRAALAANPDDGAAHARLGLLLARAGRLEESAAHLEAALRIAPEDVDAQANLGNVRLLQGRVDEAIACYEAVLRARPEDPRARENLALARAARR